MDFVIGKTRFLRELGFVQGIVDRKTTIPILANVLIEAKAGELGFRVTDLDLSLATSSEAEVNEEVVKISGKFGLDPAEWVKMLQAERNITPEQYRRDIIWPMLALKKLLQDFVMFRFGGKPQAIGHLADFNAMVLHLIFFDKQRDCPLDSVAIHLRQSLVDGVNAYRLFGQIDDGFKKC